MRLINADEIPYESGEVSLGNGNYETVNIAYEGDIDAMETVDAEPVRHGKWRDYPMRQLGFPAHIYTMHQCSVCEHAVENRTPYCPWCGARMDG